MMSFYYLMLPIQCRTFRIISKSIIKKQETLSTNSPFHIYINRINNRLMFKIIDGYKLDLQTPETMKLYGSTKN